MKTKIVFLLFLPILSCSVFADTVINSLPYTITRPGVYVLERNLTLTTPVPVLISVNASDAILDLQNHSITGSATQWIISVNSVDNVKILNGGIVNNNGTSTANGTGGGIFLNGMGGSSLLDNLNVSAFNGAVMDNFGQSNVVRNCQLQSGLTSRPAVLFTNTRNDLVENCRIFSLLIGIQCIVHSEHATNAFIGNFITVPGGGALDILNSDVAARNFGNINIPAQNSQ